MKYLLFLAIPFICATSNAQSIYAFLPEDYEVALARSAAPRELSDSADVYVLGPDGHVKVRTGTNGAACLVSRDHPESLYPICYDPEAARTVLHRHLERQRLRVSGLPEDSIAVRMAEDRSPIPQRAAVTYMMSRHQVLYSGERRVGTWHPHLMIYMPGLTPADVGTDGLENGNLSISAPGTPDAHFIVMTNEWTDAPPLPPASR